MEVLDLPGREWEIGEREVGLEDLENESSLFTASDLRRQNGPERRKEIDPSELSRAKIAANRMCLAPKPPVFRHLVNSRRGGRKGPSFPGKPRDLIGFTEMSVSPLRMELKELLSKRFKANPPPARGGELSFNFRPSYLDSAFGQQP